MCENPFAAKLTDEVIKAIAKGKIDVIVEEFPDGSRTILYTKNNEDEEYDAYSLFRDLIKMGEEDQS